VSPCLTPGPAAATRRQLLAHLGFEDALPPADGPPPADANAASLEALAAAAHAARTGAAAAADVGARARGGRPRRLWPVPRGRGSARVEPEAFHAWAGGMCSRDRRARLHAPCACKALVLKQALQPLK